jgi:hypothetical protein
MKPRKTSQTVWEKWGMLVNTPEDRKELAVKSMNYAYDYLEDKPFDKVIILAPPTILRIVNIIDISEEDIRNICDEMKFDYPIKKQILEEQQSEDIDVQYCKEFAEDYINKHK